MAYLDLYERMASHYDRDAGARYFQAALGEIRRRLPSSGLLLDFGCGTGRYAVLLAAEGYDVVGLDQSASMLDQARRKPGAERVTFILADDGYEIPEASVDAVMFIDSWECFPAPWELLLRARRALKPGGRIIIVTPRYAWRPVLTLAERVGLKKLAPAFGFGNSRLSVIRASAAHADLVVTEMASFYMSLGRIIVLTPKGSGTG